MGPRFIYALMAARLSNAIFLSRYSHHPGRIVRKSSVSFFWNISNDWIHLKSKISRRLFELKGGNLLKFLGNLGKWMEMNWVYWAGVLAILVVVGAAMSNWVRKRAKEEDAPKDDPPIYTSGVFSLVRKSPRESHLQRIPSLEAIAEVLISQPSATGSSEQYREEWVRVAELSINNIENGDKEGIQTYGYHVPDKCLATCGSFGGEAYVTRDQIHHHQRLMPPFHLGCGCEIKARASWSGGVEWSPILPVKGQYVTPDWRLVVPL